MARVWIARHLPHASGHGHPLGAQKKKNTHKQKKNNKMGKKYTQWRARGADHHCLHR